MLFINKLADFSLQIQILVCGINGDTTIRQCIFIDCKKLITIPDKRIVKSITSYRQALINIFIFIIVPLKSLFKCHSSLF